jgi:Concanavalin A-like lectin/glucanases superfamily
MKTSNRLLGYALRSCGALLFCLSLTAMAATLTNRYTFNEGSGTTAVDGVGGKDGTLVNNTFSGTGSAELSNPFALGSGDPSGIYVDLPDNLVSNYTSITMEVWLTPTHDDTPNTGAFWNRIWDFGNSDGNAGIVGFMWARSGNSSQGIRADTVPPGNGDIVNGPIIPSGQQTHIVFTSDGGTLRGRLYVNGVQAGANDTFDSTPAAMGVTTNDWLGRSQFAADAYLIGSINEFRIYDGALNPLEAAADFQNGPDTVSSAYGTVTNVQLTVASPLSIGSGTQAAVKVRTTVLTNAIEIVDSDFVINFVSANTNVVTVSSNGIVQAIGSGTANVIATFSSISSTQAVQVILIPTKMVHRYSFSNDVSDTVGTANGTLNGTASVANGRANLDGQLGTYVSLPPYLLASSNLANGCFTIESWATVYPTAATWANLFAFGNSAGGLGQNYTFFVPMAGGNFRRFAVGTFGAEDVAQQGGNLLGVTNFHLVCVFNPNPARRFMGLYVNGTLVGQNNAPNSILSTINSTNAWLGRSLFSADPFLPGEVDEFRIYDGELDKFQIAASFQAGPDQTNFNVGTFTSFVLNVGPPTLALDEFRQAAAIMNFSLATNVNVTGDATLTLTSSDTNVLTITSPAGLVQARGLGTATLTAVYRYIVGVTTNSYTNSAAPITTFIPAAQLRHRYSFNATSGDIVSDSVGGSDGFVTTAATGITNSTWTGVGQLTINTNTTLGAQDTYVDLPDNMINVLTSNATFEVWATDFASGIWARYWDFGSAPGQPNIFLDQASGGQANRPRFDWSSGNISAPAANAVADGALAYIVVTYDDDENSAVLYINGTRVQQSTVAGLPLSTLTDVNAWLGRSQFPDPFLLGSYDEFRIYSGLLTAAEIQKHFLNGPNALINDVKLNTSVGTGNITIAWPTYGAHFTLQSSSTLGPSASWATVATATAQSGTNYQVTVPLTGSAQFFRMQRQW